MILYEEISKEILGAYYDVYNNLGFGFLEQVYQNAMFKELTKRGLFCDCQKHLDVVYKNEVVGHYVPDIIVENKIILELKALSEINGEHEAQILNYLKATGIEIGFLMNFGSPTPYYKRYINNFTYRKINRQ